MASSTPDSFTITRDDMIALEEAICFDGKLTYSEGNSYVVRTPDTRGAHDESCRQAQDILLKTWKEAGGTPDGFEKTIFRAAGDNWVKRRKKEEDWLELEELRNKLKSVVQRGSLDELRRMDNGLPKTRADEIVVPPATKAEDVVETEEVERMKEAEKEDDERGAAPTEDKVDGVEDIEKTERGKRTKEE